jgi:hypothetical protein
MYTTRIRRIDDVCHVITLPTAILGRLQQQLLTSETTCLYIQGDFEDTKGVIRIRKLKKNRKHNGQKMHAYI